MVVTRNPDRPEVAVYAATTWEGGESGEGLDAVVGAIADGASQIQDKVRAAVLGDTIGSSGEVNVQGEIVQYLDTAASNTFVNALVECGRVAAIGSEEIEGTVVVGDTPDHEYVVQMDPLDGSSNIDVAVSIGSIFGVWRREAGEPVSDASLLQPGSRQVAAAYVVYGSSAVMVMASGHGVRGFTLDPETGKFLLTHGDLRIPDECPYYSANEGNFTGWNTATQEAVVRLRDRHSLRYVGSLVADFHRNLIKGGVFLYPADTKNRSGKLRLMYEANPLAFIAEHAGGAAYSDTQRILDIQPEQPHQRIPLIIGNREVVEKTVDIMNGR